MNKTYLPVIQEFMILDLLEYITPEIKRCKTFEEADAVYKNLVKNNF